MTNKDKLMEILRQVKCYGSNVDEYYLNNVADRLVESGVIVPPCKVGDKLYNADSLIYEYCYWEVEIIKIYADGNYIVDDSGNLYSFADIGKTVFLTKEEAEAELRKRSDNNG